MLAEKMNNIEIRDKKIELNAGKYYLAKRIFLLGTVFSFISFISLSFLPSKESGVINNDEPIFWSIVICFITYKWASARVQHIETIRNTMSPEENGHS